MQKCIRYTAIAVIIYANISLRNDFSAHIRAICK
jgi:hypothetical protein